MGILMLYLICLICPLGLMIRTRIYALTAVRTRHNRYLDGKYRIVHDIPGPC